MALSRRRGLLIESVVDHFLGLPWQHRFVRCLFSPALCLVAVEREIPRCCNCARSQFVDQTPTLLALPALVLFIPDWRRRFQFLLINGVVGLTTYVPALIQDPAIIFTNVFGYRPQLLHTTAGIPAWGTRVLFLPSSRRRHSGRRRFTRQSCLFSRMDGSSPSCLPC